MHLYERICKDQDELERFYFMKKVYRSIEAFASHMQLLPEIRFLRQKLQ